MTSAFGRRSIPADCVAASRNTVGVFLVAAPCRRGVSAPSVHEVIVTRALTAVCVLGGLFVLALPSAVLADEQTSQGEVADEDLEERLDNRGRLGIGYQASLGGAQGLTLRFGAGPVVLSGLVGLRLISPDGEDLDTRFGAEFAVAVAIPFQRWDGTHFGLGIRAAIGAQHIQVRNADTNELEGADPFGMAFELPLYVEAWLSQRITLLVETGVVLNVIGDENSPLRERPAGIEIGLGTGGLFGSAGLAFYF
jgi:hypothetical protein